MNCAYATLISGDDFFLGAASLYFSLLEVKSKYPLIMMITNKTSNDILNQAIDMANHCTNLIISYINDDKFLIPHQSYASTINKFQMLNYKEYDKIMFLDADTLVDENIDYLFQINLPYLFK